ncbi:hypothetical protein [Diaphorobacter sp.]|uniref:hypothetical protein n=1 Tax=Diaphorobacter sp. TaxID=1934310 RepID=UPI00289F2E42|nr:hypothetical protein [Diaphorobacter sp.]
MSTSSCDVALHGNPLFRSAHQENHDAVVRQMGEAACTMVGFKNSADFGGHAAAELRIYP